MISVIIPYWNAEKWIGRCVQSLIIQSGDIEFIMVNDGSTDNGEAVARNLADSRFIFADNSHAKGVSGARNTGIDIARGEWITFLDVDDELVPEASAVFERMTRLDPTANIIQSNHLRYYEKSGRIALKLPNKKGVYNLEELPMWWCMVWNKLLRKEFINECGIRFVEGLQYGEDEIFNLDMYEKDDRIFHTMTNTVTVMRHFDNKESLSHIKGKSGLIAHAHALEDYIMRCDNPRARLAVCKLLSSHWTSKTYLKAFGEDS